MRLIVLIKIRVSLIFINNFMMIALKKSTEL